MRLNDSFGNNTIAALLTIIIQVPDLANPVLISEGLI